MLSWHVPAVRPAESPLKARCKVHWSPLEPTGARWSGAVRALSGRYRGPCRARTGTDTVKITINNANAPLKKTTHTEVLAQRPGCANPCSSPCSQCDLQVANAKKRVSSSPSVPATPLQGTCSPPSVSAGSREGDADARVPRCHPQRTPGPRPKQPYGLSTRGGTGLEPVGRPAGIQLTDS